MKKRLFTYLLVSICFIGISKAEVVLQQLNAFNLESLRVGYAQKLGDGHVGYIDKVTWKVNKQTGNQVDLTTLQIVVSQCETDSTDCTSFFNDSYSLSDPLRDVGGLLTNDPAAVDIAGHFSTPVSLFADKYYLIAIYTNDATTTLRSYLDAGDPYYPAENWGSYQVDTDTWTYDTYAGQWDWKGSHKDLWFIAEGSTTPLPTDPEVNQEDDFIFIADQEVEFDLSGDMVYTGVGYRARMDFFKQCEDVGGAFNLESHVVGTINWYADDAVTETEYLGNYQYIGAGYTTTDSTFGVDVIRLPFDNGLDCTFPFVITIYDANGNIIYQELDPQVNNWELIPSTSTSHIDNIIEDPDLDNSLTAPFAWLFHKLRLLITDIFNFSGIQQTFFDSYELINAFALTKSPFAYLDAVYNLDYAAPLVLDSEVVFALELDGLYFLEDYDVDLDPLIDSGILAMRTVIGVGLWVSFIFYLIVLYKRFL